MHYFLLILLAYTALVFDSVFAESLATGPRFWPLTIAAAAVTLTGWRVLLCAAGFGLAADCLSTGPLGTGMFCASVAALAAQSLRTRETVSAGRFAVLAGALALVQPVVAGVLQRELTQAQSAATFNLLPILTSAAWTTLVAWVLAHLFKTLQVVSPFAPRKGVLSRSESRQF